MICLSSLICFGGSTSLMLPCSWAIYMICIAIVVFFHLSCSITDTMMSSRIDRYVTKAWFPGLIVNAEKGSYEGVVIFNNRRAG